ncbi:hypothetical protein NL676_032873 [Syzygium grande]|nr:hypothetical protein NL676_032873 [Syzygium grande]
MTRRPPDSSERRRQWSRKRSVGLTAIGKQGLIIRDVPERRIGYTAKRWPLSDQVYVRDWECVLAKATFIIVGNI